MLPLEGIRVLELARLPPHFFCTMMLADMGADVVKIEIPVHENANNKKPTAKDNKVESPDPVYQAFNRNKRSISVDLKSAEGKQVFYKLAVTADVVLDGFRPGVVKGMGVDYETLSALNPKIICCSVSGYGQDGPYRLLPGHDINYISFGGVLGVIGDKRGNPVIPSNLVADYAGGALHAVVGILLALEARHHTGCGQRIDVSMTDAVVSILSGRIAEYQANSQTPGPGEGLLNGAFPCYGVFKTRDNKYISLGCIEPHFWENLCHALSRKDLIAHQWDKGKKREQIFSYLKRKFLTRTRDEWFEELSKKDIPVSKVYSLDETLSDPQILHRQMIQEVSKPGKGKIKQIGIPIKLSNTPGKIRTPAPFPGEHTDEVLKELGYSTTFIRDLRKKGVVA